METYIATFEKWFVIPLNFRVLLISCLLFHDAYSFWKWTRQAALNWILIPFNLTWLVISWLKFYDASSVRKLDENVALACSEPVVFLVSSHPLFLSHEHLNLFLPLKMECRGRASKLIFSFDMFLSLGEHQHSLISLLHRYTDTCKYMHVYILPCNDACVLWNCNFH